MDQQDNSIEALAPSDIKERMRSFRMFLGLLRWSTATAALVLLLLLLFKTHG